MTTLDDARQMSTRPPVRSVPMGRKESAVVSRAQLRRQRGAVERWTAWVVLFVSFLGTIVALSGGWVPFLSSLRALHPNWAAVLGGLAIQGLLTFLEWHYFDRRLISWGARIGDAYMTAIGYGPLVVVGLAAALAARGAPAPLYAAWFIIGLVSLGVAWYPESRLVE
jgi:hypothetical protein